MFYKARLKKSFIVTFSPLGGPVTLHIKTCGSVKSCPATLRRQFLSFYSQKAHGSENQDKMSVFLSESPRCTWRRICFQVDKEFQRQEIFLYTSKPPPVVWMNSSSLALIRIKNVHLVLSFQTKQQSALSLEKLKSYSHFFI